MSKFKFYEYIWVYRTVMSFRSSFAIFFLCLFIVSCKKDEPQNFSNAIFNAVAISKDGNVKMYAENGRVVQDQNLINAFTGEPAFLLNYDSTVASGEQVKFVNADSVYFVNADGSVARRYAYEVHGNTIFFNETHTEIVFQNDANLESLYSSIVKYSPIYSEITYTTGIGGLQGRRTVNTTAVGLISKTELKVYQFAFKLQNGLSNPYVQYHSSMMMNQFNDNFPKKLTAQQQLALQPYVLTFTRSN